MNKFTLVLLLGLSTHPLMGVGEDVATVSQDTINAQESRFKDLYQDKSGYALRNTNINLLIGDFLTAKKFHMSYWVAKLGLTLFEKELNSGDATSKKDKYTRIARITEDSEALKNSQHSSYSVLLTSVITAADKINSKVILSRALLHDSYLKLHNSEYSAAIRTAERVIQLIDTSKDNLTAEQAFALNIRAHARLLQNRNSRSIDNDSMDSVKLDITRAALLFINLPQTLAPLGNEGLTEILEINKLAADLRVIDDIQQPHKPQNRQAFNDRPRNRSTPPGRDFSDRRGIAQKSDHRGGGRNPQEGRGYANFRADYRHQDTTAPQSRRGGLYRPVKQEEQN